VYVQQNPQDSSHNPSSPRAGTADDALNLPEYAVTAGELGACAAQTVIVALLPLLIQPYARGNFWIGFAVGGEGVFALLLPFIVGTVSDRLPPRLAGFIGRHSFFLVLTTPIMAAALVLLPFLSGYWLMTAVTFVFFAAQHTYMTPLMTLMLDAVPDRKRARAQAVNSVYHSIGLAYGLVVAGLLFTLWKPLPFIVSAVLLVITTAVTVWAEHRLIGGRKPMTSEVLGAESQQILQNLRRNPPALWLLTANALWNGAVDGIRPYFLVFALVVTGVTVADTSLGLMLLVGCIVIGSMVFGRLGDRYERTQLLEYGVALGVIAMALGYFVRDTRVALIVLVIAGIGAAAMTTLPYPLFASLMGERGAGQYSGLFVVSVSVGRLCAPMFVGAAIDLGARVLPEYEGYPFMWPAAALLAALGWFALRQAKRAGQQRLASAANPAP